ncbi:TRAP transporter substrate-binding protein [Fluviibacterium sp. DFM31]|uniref:TRAP transporter substrate-binding protein n=1 Tax=Meridianimarinicoccus marinus TaxID=3231483 RepID=A0ABV3L836_9RHOB
MNPKPLILSALLAVAAAPVAAEQLRFLSQFLPTAKQYPNEMAGLDALAADEALDIDVSVNEYKALGLSTADGLRLARAGTFDVTTIQIGTASRDDAFLEGLDLIGVSTDMDSLRVAVDAYREAFDARLQDKFGAKVLALWPFGPQVFYCNEEITSLDDLNGLKVRSFTPSMSALLESLGATPVTLSFPEVYPALQRKVASCGVTSPTSGNTGKWPEVTTHQLPLSVSGSVQGYVASLDWWNGLSPAQQDGVATAFKAIEESQWATAVALNGDALACNTGQDTCADHEKFSLALVDVSEADIAKVQQASVEVVLPDWAARCEASYPGCTAVWNETVGAARGVTIPE